MALEQRLQLTRWSDGLFFAALALSVVCLTVTISLCVVFNGHLQRANRRLDGLSVEGTRLTQDSQFWRVERSGSEDTEEFARTRSARCSRDTPRSQNVRFEALLDVDIRDGAGTSVVPGSIRSGMPWYASISARARNSYAE